MDDSRAAEFMRLFLAHERRLYGLLVTQVPHLADADDLLQEVSASMWSKFGDFRPGSDFWAWGRSFVRFAVLKHYEKARTAGRVTFSDALLDRIADDVAAAAPTMDRRQEALRDCLARLTARVRDLLRERYEPGRTLHDAAARAGMTDPAAYKALSRAHDALLKCMHAVLGAPA